VIARASVRSPPAARSRGSGLGVGAAVVFGEAGRFLVPAGEPGVLEYYRSHLLVAHRLRDRLRRLPLPGTRGRGAALFDRWWIVDGAAGGAGGAPGRWQQMLAVLAGALDAGLLAAAPPELTSAGSGPRWILIADYPASRRRKLLALLFAPGGAEPLAVLRLRPEAGEGPPLAREAEALAALRRRLPPALAASVPRPLGRAEPPGWEALLLSALPGRPAYVELHGALAPGRLAARHLDAAASWLGRFHAATRTGGAAAPPAEGTLPLGAGGLAWLRAAAPLLRRSPLPLSAVHGDFWARNLLLAPGGAAAGVVDWEACRPEASPAEDLFGFPLAYGLDFPGRRRRPRPADDAFARTFIADTRLARAVRRYLAGYCAAAGLDPAPLATLFRLHLLTRARDAADADLRERWLRWERRIAEAGRSVFSG